MGRSKKQKPPSTTGRTAKVSSSKAKSPVKASSKKSGSIPQTSFAKHSPVNMERSSSFSDCSASSTVDVGYSDFVPTALPSGNIAITSDVKALFKETLNVMSKIDFSTLSNEKSIDWNIALSHSCRRLSYEYSRLQTHFALLQESDIEKKKSADMEEFAKQMYPLIKKRSHDLFIKMPFPSTKEVTTTNGNSLSNFGLTHASPIATIVFDELLFKPQGSSALDSISPDDHLSTKPRHEYDCPTIRDDLWVNHGIGTWTVKELGRIRNTVTNVCRDVLRK
jgi:hypothetical protein